MQAKLKQHTQEFQLLKNSSAHEASISPAPIPSITSKISPEMDIPGDVVCNSHVYYIGTCVNLWS